MVSIVIISHSKKIAEGVVELAKQMASQVQITSCGGTKDNQIGTDLDLILKAINKVWSQDGVLILFDLGSALMNAEMAVEMLDNNKKANVKIIDVALVEGAILAAVNSSMNKSLDEIIKELEVLKLNKF
ncbi:dihydroxyacetone kinase phosphoryl donor subunit DhaM [Mycoplasma putrefaciens]|uniref:phosphoenolpyruvate--glycerone phosphotransferase n=2 Tax=Mycoplasma putrefaciens TaxID=2123 RepID=M9WHX6_9MOLU|nr:dihydroxyacetone kinase phosphoryl donor subunit DhaM [Mycoplasma putrefaciens]AEM68448.1 dihydroxyacetone kinase phosphotransfer subunit [Mycoplasma putrefaciens KS1]AGJ91090.1 Hypothetical protein MPUT9231_6970 [Mycoplasma putrefaciens Mput9231]